MIVILIPIISFSLLLSVSRLAFPNDPNDHQGLPMRLIRIPSRALQGRLSPLLPRPVDRQGVDHSPRAAPERRRCLHPPGHPERLPDSQYRRRTRRSRVCFLWDCVKIGPSLHKPFMLSGDFRIWARETGSRLAHKPIKSHFFKEYNCFFIALSQRDTL
jgi:hypothetical protein